MISVSILWFHPQLPEVENANRRNRTSLIGREPGTAETKQLAYKKVPSLSLRLEAFRYHEI
jgi:hypothetical protein